MKPNLFIDLDDTLTTTFEDLIVGLEHRAAEAIAGVVHADFAAGDLARSLLARRLSSPAAIDAWLESIAGPAAVEIRREILADFDIGPLRLCDGAQEVLERLVSDYCLVLLTEGRPSTQRRKIKALGVGRYFESVVIVNEWGGASKEMVIANRLARCEGPCGRHVVVGNRIDREIAAGHRLGTCTAWVRTGEGREIDLTGFDTPSITLDALKALPDALDRLFRVPGSNR